MLKLASTLFASGWFFVAAIHWSGHLSWDNKLLWFPPIFLTAATMLGLGGWDRPEDRVPLLFVAVLSFCSLLGYAVMYFFLFGLVGK